MNVYIVTTIVILNLFKGNFLIAYYSPKLVKKQSDTAEGFEVST